MGDTSDWKRKKGRIDILEQTELHTLHVTQGVASEVRALISYTHLPRLNLS